MGKNLLRVILIIIVLTALWKSADVFGAEDAQPEFLVTWEARTYVPPGFQGKALPIFGSVVAVSFDLVDQSGKLVDLSKDTVYWYLDGELVKSGTGIQQLNFIVNRGEQSVRINLPNRFLFKTINIPVVQPEAAAIMSPAVFGNIVHDSFQVRAVPYFFNTTDPSNLNFSWKINGRRPDNLENPRILDVGLPADTLDDLPLNIEIRITDDRGKILDTASRLIRLIFKK